MVFGLSTLNSGLSTGSGVGHSSESMGFWLCLFVCSRLFCLFSFCWGPLFFGPSSVGRVCGLVASLVVGLVVLCPYSAAALPVLGLARSP